MHCTLFCSLEYIVGSSGRAGILTYFFLGNVVSWDIYLGHCVVCQERAMQEKLQSELESIPSYSLSLMAKRATNQALLLLFYLLSFNRW